MQKKFLTIFFISLLILVGCFIVIAADTDSDGIDDSVDNCPTIANADQTDTDSDDVGNVCDNCIGVSNTDQSDIDADGVGDMCDTDIDEDGVLNGDDNCPTTSNPDQTDTDGDGVGNVCDNCIGVDNPSQEDMDMDTIGDSCDTDIDGDLIDNTSDNCVTVDNPDQSDTDIDGLGDSCDDDIDGDSVLNGSDNCIVHANSDQADADTDGVGDVCDTDIDGDSVLNESDNCPTTANSDQADADTDGVGDVCDTIAACNNGVDDDLDGDIDMADAGCSDINDDDESDFTGGGMPDVIFSEFYPRMAGLDNDRFELQNLSSSDIDLAGRTVDICDYDGSCTTKSLNYILPAQGLLTFTGTLINTVGGTLILKDSLGDTGTQVVYNNSGAYSGVNPIYYAGNIPNNNSAIQGMGGTWSFDSTPTKGRFNDATNPASCDDLFGYLSTPPTLEFVDYCLSTAARGGITTSIGEIDDSGYTDPTNTAEDGLKALRFEKPDFGRIIRTEELNLTDQNTTKILQLVGEQLDMGTEGRIGFDDDIDIGTGTYQSAILQNSSARIRIYNVNTLGIYGNVPAFSITALDSDTLAPLAGGAIPTLSDGMYSSSNGGTLYFDTDHFTTFDMPELTGSFSIRQLPDTTGGYTNGTSLTIDLIASQAAEYIITGDIVTDITGTIDASGLGVDYIEITTGEGTKNIYVQYSTGDFLYSKTYSGKVMYDITSPVVTAKKKTNNTTIEVTFNEELQDNDFHSPEPGDFNIFTSSGFYYTILGATYANKKVTITTFETLSGTLTLEIPETILPTTLIDRAGNIAYYDSGYTTTISATISSNGGGSAQARDVCPDGDFSPSRYDHTCAATTTGTNLTGTNLTGTTAPDQPGSTEDSSYSTERNNAYLRAYSMGITTMPTIQQAEMEESFTRAHMAKMIVNFTTNVLGKNNLNHNAACDFNDISDQPEEMQEYIRVACQLGLMGVKMDTFQPNGPVTRAQCGTAISRALRGTLHDGGTPYHLNHLNALKNADIINNTDPNLIELKGYVMLMLMRANQ